MILQGFIDLHTHGIGKYDTRTGNPEDILRMAELHGMAGTRAILPTIYSGPIEEMRKNIEAVRKAMEIQRSGVRSQKSEIKRKSAKCKMQSCKEKNSKLKIQGAEVNSLLVTARLSSPKSRYLALILGVHIEGPFLNPVRCGALNKDSFVRPTLSSLKKLIYGYEDIIKIITIAPEMPGALRVIEKCSEIGIRVNMGHSDATYKQAVDGKKAGAEGITHIFNAMRPFHHREIGLAGLGLIDEDLYIEVIADGIHLHPKTLELIFNLKRLDRIILVSDSVKVSKAGKGGVFNKNGILSGTSITTSDSVKILKKVSIPDAGIIETATDNPARFIGRNIRDRKFSFSF